MPHFKYLKCTKMTYFVDPFGPNKGKNVVFEKITLLILIM